MSRQALRVALESALREFSGPRGIPVAAENRTFRAGSCPRLEATITIADERAAALGDGAADKVDGFMQVDVVVRSGEGTHEADCLKDALAAHFARRRLEENGVVVVVSGVRAAPSGYARNAEYILPVDIRFTAYATFQRG